MINNILEKTNLFDMFKNLLNELDLKMVPEHSLLYKEVSNGARTHFKTISVMKVIKNEGHSLFGFGETVVAMISEEQFEFFIKEILANEDLPTMEKYLDRIFSMSDVNIKHKITNKPDWFIEGLDVLKANIERRRIEEALAITNDQSTTDETTQTTKKRRM